MKLTAAAFPVLLPVLHRLEAERAHQLTIAALKRLPAGTPAAQPAGLAVDALGLHFANPLGLAAGFDKNAEVADAMLGLGFGFVELGTVTPLPQAGNPKPRLFRLSEDRAVFNRMGFNGEGAGAVLRRLAARAGEGGIIGINIGANKDSADRIGDYVSGLKRFGEVASYIAVNISSPNTPGLRGLQAAGDYDELIARLTETRARLARPAPLLVKIAPDLDDAALDAIAAISLARGVDGLIVSNTTLARPPLKSRHRSEAGGLSGAPLFSLSTRVLARMYQRTGSQLTLIGVGGVSDAATALAKIEAGASLIQLYSALVYRGPGLIGEILSGLASAMAAHGVAELSSLTGSRANQWAKPE